MIQILEGSFREHRTVDSITVTTEYIMTWSDYYNGYGDFVDENFEKEYTWHAPYEGDNYSVFFNTSYLSELVLTDITMEPTSIVRTSFDNSKQDFDKSVKVTYTWSNTTGESDTKRTYEASSWKIRYNTSLEYQGVNTYIDATDKSLHVWADDYLTELNPTMEFPEIEGEPDPRDGSYNGADDNVKQDWKDRVIDTIPELQIRIPRTTCSITVYSKEVLGAKYASWVSAVNSDDFLFEAYDRKEQGLIAKNKLPGYDANDWVNSDDTGLWQFIDWEMEDLGNSFFEYVLTFEYDPYGWNAYNDSVVSLTPKKYVTTNFYNTFLKGLDTIPPNDRSSR